MNGAIPALRPEWLTVKETVAYLKLGSRNALYRLIHEHRLPYGRCGREYRFRRDHVDRWLEVRGVNELQIVSRTA